MSDLGVVDPIRVPARLQPWLDRIPVVARIFIVLALLDFTVRAIGIFEPGFGANPIGSLVGFFLPRAAIILLPAIVILRRPTAQSDTPWVFYGAIFVALVRLLDRPTETLVSGILQGSDIAPIIVLGMVDNLVIAIAWVTLARGMTALNPRDPEPVAKGLANLAFGAIAVAQLVTFLAYLVTESRASGALETGLPIGSAAVASISALGFGYLLWTVGRAFDDPNRTERATRLAGGAITLQAIGSVMIAVIGAWYVLVPATVFGVTVDLASAPTYMAEIATVLLVVAFALGLADPLRPMARDWEAAATSA